MICSLALVVHSAMFIQGQGVWFHKICKYECGESKIERLYRVDHDVYCPLTYDDQLKPALYMLRPGDGSLLAITQVLGIMKEDDDDRPNISSVGRGECSFIDANVDQRRARYDPGDDKVCRSLRGHPGGRAPS